MTNDATATRSSVWRRLSRGQFGLRFLLALMFVAAIGVWWYVQPKREGISKYEASKIKVGMTMRQVHSLLGGPAGGGGGHGVTLFTYRVKASYWMPQDLFFDVRFKGDTVNSLEFRRDPEFAAEIEHNRKLNAARSRK